MVLDEADRMLDMGFEKEVRAIIGATPTSLTRQTVMFSATWPRDAAKLASDFLSQPLRVNIGSAELSASHTITQIVEVLEMVRRPPPLSETAQYATVHPPAP
jgi:superfamily II DNA/RNA helicase